MSLLPTVRFVPCPECRELVRAGAARCPHCDASLSEGTGMLCTAALLVSGLTLSGCLVTAVYGVPGTESDSFEPPLSTGSGTAADTSTSTGTPTTGTPTTGAPTTGTTTTSTGTTADETTGTTTGEPGTGTTTTGTDTGATTTG